MRKQDLWIPILAVAIAVVVTAAVFWTSRMETGSWGLSFRQEGAAPIGNAGKDQLKQYDAAYIGDTSQKVLYLTFDAGYENGSTAKILDILKQQQIPAEGTWTDARISGQLVLKMDMEENREILKSFLYDKDTKKQK